MEWTDIPARGGRLLIACTLLAALLSAGCTSLVPRDSPLPRDGATMSDVYRNHMNGDAVDASAGPRDRLPLRGADDDAVVEHRRALSAPLNNRFERLPNPDLTLHVFPHLAQGRYPVPGYDTVFPMYESVQYAMPGEVAPRHQAAGSFVHPAPETGKLAPPTEAQASADALRKRQRLADLAAAAPHHARVLTEYDRIYTERCGTSLTGDQLFLVPSSATPAFDRMLDFAALGRDSDGARVGVELMRCDVPQRKATTPLGAATGASSGASAGASAHVPSKESN